MSPPQNLCLAIVVFLVIFANLSEGELKVGSYSQTCPNAESIVKSVVKEATAADPRMPPILLRLHFHDCFVEGCDGSILINSGDSSKDERAAGGHQGVEGFDQIKKAKEEIEAECPGIVSCADIVAMAARDAVALVDIVAMAARNTLAGGPTYEVETGRKDGRVSKIEDAQDLPEVNDSIETLKSKFESKGLSNLELVILSGAHTIGTTACFFMPQRLYEFNSSNEFDPQINPTFLPELRKMCPKNGDQNARIPMDPVTGGKFDNQIMKNIEKGFAVIASDARLNDDEITKRAVGFYAGGSLFGRDFATAMVRMGRIGVKVGSDGEIRRNCSAFN